MNEDLKGIPCLGTVRHVQEGSTYPDSIIIGTPGKGGEVKIYFNADDEAGAMVRIKTAFRLRQLAHNLQEGVVQP